jgi:hypothetical protein
MSGAAAEENNAIVDKARKVKRDSKSHRCVGLIGRTINKPLSQPWTLPISHPHSFFSPSKNKLKKVVAHQTGKKRGRLSDQSNPHRKNNHWIPTPAPSRRHHASGR